ncbi:hypothetical protein NEOC65_001423 [Neochlamydia sp. AcF65]|nr:hypothetical protein [Neochlamydia sp. AcF65]
MRIGLLTFNIDQPYANFLLSFREERICFKKPSRYFA